jgi:hypothetical protein
MVKGKELKKQGLRGYCVAHRGIHGVICKECLTDKNYQTKQEYNVIAKIHTKKDIPKDFIHKDSPDIKKVYYCHECGKAVL